MAAGALAAVGARYVSISQKHPFVAPSTIGFVIAVGGDIGCQAGIERRSFDEWDMRRTAEMGAIRAFVMAPMLQLYFPALGRLIPGTSMKRVLARVTLDQAVGSPVTIALTFLAAALLQGRVRELPDRLVEQGPATWMTGACYWPFVHCVNFRFVPPAVQPLVAHVMSVPWNAVLSYRANLKLGSSAKDAAGVASDDLRTRSME